MRIEVKTRLYAGIIIAATLFIVEFLRGKEIFSKNNTYYIIYPSVDGIEVSTAVTVGGFPAGRISEIQYNRESADYSVQVSISRQLSIPEDSRMLIYSSDIRGPKKIKVAAGTSSVPASAGDTLTGGFEADMLSTLAGSISPVAAGLDTLIQNLNTAVTSVNLLLSESNREQVSALLSTLSSTADDLSVLSGTLRDRSPEISDIILRLNSISAALDSAAASAGNTLANAEEITAGLRDAGLGAAVDSIRILTGRLQDPSGSIGRLITSDSLYNSITRLSNDLDSLIRGIKEDPKKYIKISVF